MSIDQRHDHSPTPTVADLAVFAEHAPDGMALVRSDLTIVWCNAALSLWTGRLPDELTGQSLGGVIDGDLGLTTATGRHAVLHMANGHDAPVEIWCMAHPHAGLRAITVRRLEGDLSEHHNLEERWQFALECAGHGVWDWDARTNKVVFSSLWKSMLGYGDDEIGDSLDEWSSRVHPDDLERAMADVMDHLEGRTPIYINEHRMRCKDGSWKWIADRGMVVHRDAEGRPLRVVGTHTDITRLKQAEIDAEAAKQLIEQTNAALEEAQALARVGNWLFDLRNAHFTWSKQLYAIFGRGEKLGSPVFIEVQDYLQPDDAIRLHEAVIGASINGTPFNITLETQCDPPAARFIRCVGQAQRSAEGIITHLTGTAMDVTEEVVRERAAVDYARTLNSMVGELDRLANRDPLTDLINRRRFMTLAAERAEHGVGVMFIDLDNFKLINDSLGHKAGDSLLVQVGQRLTEAVRADDLVGRLGGDEFAVLLPAPINAETAMTIAQSIVSAMQQPVDLGCLQVMSTASVGVVLPGHAETVEEIIQCADIAMYQAKLHGRSRAVLYEPWMSEEVQARLVLETDLRRALEEGQLELHYQPLLDFASGRLHEVEALIRWRHPERGMIRPDEFIPLAEEIGMIEPIGRWVLSEACRQAVAWQSAHPSLSHLRVAVNVSGRQLAAEGFVADVEAALQASGLDPACLTLEITETVIMTDIAVTTERLVALGKLGVKVAMDDFGTGYSSLGTLARLPIHTVKIDRSFVSVVGEEIGPVAIIRAIVTLCKILGLTVVAEGVETSDQFTQLYSLGCDLAQGYLLSRPLPAAEFEASLEDGNFCKVA